MTKDESQSPTLELRLTQLEKKVKATVADRQAERTFDPDVAMLRLFYMVIAGCFVIFLFSLSSLRCPPASGCGALSSFSIGIMIALAATVAGGLLGFIFGVPYSRDGGPGDRDPSTGEKKTEVVSSGSAYRPNTSLEQISEWLSKMLVGVGLVELKTLTGKLGELAQRLASGLGGGTRAETFVLGVLIYFAIGGFLFGFIWARIYLRRWFVAADADSVKKLDDRLSRFENDSNALALASQQLHRSGDQELATEQDLIKVFQKASSPIRAQIFEQARSVSEDKGAPDYRFRNQAAISILKALTALDEEEFYHRTRAELSYALSRQKPPDLPAAIEAISEAIRIRDKNQVKGWKSYEFRRARYRIQLDDNFKNKQPSDATTRELIQADLRAAHEDQNKWQGRLDDNPDVAGWINLNAVVL